MIEHDYNDHGQQSDTAQRSPPVHHCPQVSATGRWSIRCAYRAADLQWKTRIDFPVRLHDESTVLIYSNGHLGQRHQGLIGDSLMLTSPFQLPLA